MANKDERRRRAREERLRQEAAEAAAERRHRMVQLGAGALFAALVVIGILIAVSQSGSDSGGESLDCGRGGDRPATGRPPAEWDHPR